MSAIKLQSNEGKTRTLDIRVAQMSDFLKNMLELVKEVDKPVVLDMSWPVVDKVVQWMEYHSNDAIESEEDSDEDEDESSALSGQDMSAWDKKFFEVDNQMLFDVILAANFLDIKALLRIGCKVAAEQLKGKSAEEVRQLWRIECDLCPEEEERLKRENAWTEK